MLTLKLRNPNNPTSENESEGGKEKSQQKPFRLIFPISNAKNQFYNKY
jgi:hypothetical protein